MIWVIVPRNRYVCFTSYQSDNSIVIQWRAANFSVKHWKIYKHLIIATLTFNKDIVGMVFWNQSIWLYVVTLLLPVLFIKLGSSPGAPLAHLFLHGQQTLIQLVSLQQAGQLELRKVSRMLKGSKQESVLKGRSMGDGVSAKEGKWYLWRFLVQSPTFFGKLLHVFQYLMFHFRGQAGKFFWVDIHRVGVIV